MRRGHPGLGGWRNENLRHFRPRNSGGPHYRPPRNYHIDVPRFPPPGLRPRGPHAYSHHQHIDSIGPPEHHGRKRGGGHQGPQRNHSQDRHMYQYTHQMRPKNHNHDSSYDKSRYYKDLNQIAPMQINSMGDVDHRLPSNVSQNQEYNRHQTSWSNMPSDKHRIYYDGHRSPQKHHRPCDNVDTKALQLDYTGHRPPSSDHYGSTPLPTNNNDTSFSRSVDDTVDIVRKRLMNRNEPRLPGDMPVDHSTQIADDLNSSYQNLQQEQPTKKRIQRQKQTVKSNCDKMKNKIVHQLFKMDKDKIHKLMDNPSSSTKFEYAISSLITESQNSFNRHLRSVAEKSLCSTSTEFIHNDNNTIYEDTFMKQMQCILDPQDTVLLEDIKPLVLAELSKVLQLDNIEQKYDDPNEDINIYQPTDPKEFNYYNDICSNDEYAQEFYNSPIPILNHETPYSIETNEVDSNYNETTICEDTKPVFEKQEIESKENYIENRRWSSDSQRQSRRSIDLIPSENIFKKEKDDSLSFDTNAEQLSEEEDPFAELDKQYHVVVDPIFIENDDLSITGKQTDGKSIDEDYNKLYSNNDSNEIIKEIDNQLLDLERSVLKVSDENSGQIMELPHIQHTTQVSNVVKQDIHNSSLSSNDISLSEQNMQEYNKQKEDEIPRTNVLEKHLHIKIGEDSNIKKTSRSISRKRSLDQKPCHTKEKRKKRDSCCSQPDMTTQMLNKNSVSNTEIIVKSETGNGDEEASKSIFNQFFAKENSDKDMRKDSKNVFKENREYSDKYVKRKELQKMAKPTEIRKKRTSSSSSHSMVSPKDNTNKNNNNSNQIPTKTDAKSKLKTIDMFIEQPRKVNIHQAHRNTAPIPTTPTIAPVKVIEESKTKVPVQPQKPIMRHVGTQVIKRFITKECQTIDSASKPQIEMNVKSIQTDPVFVDKSKPKSTNAFERMKEIDMEIQILLQEKFKLYSSLESKDSCNNDSTLGMAVLNVAPIGDTNTAEVLSNEITLSEDAIVENFTSIPVEELEQIAFETVNDEINEMKVQKRSRRQKILQERQSSESPTTAKKGNRKVKIPNISLIEQIITHEGPIEDTISLDILETTPIKSRKKPQKQPKKKPVRKTKVPPTPVIDYASLYKLKECSVVITREDITKYLDLTHVNKYCTVNKTGMIVNIEELTPITEEEIAAIIEPERQTEEVIEETIVNMQIDMLDVSEDIVIGENYEEKCEKYENDRIDVPICEEIILDNSQSSMEDMVTPGDTGQNDNECKTYDYSADENLKRDSVSVTGNADAVLAIECIDNDFIAACLDGNVYHFSGDGQLITTLRGSNLAVTCLTIVKEKYGTTVYTGSLDSRIRYYDLETGMEKGMECNVLSPIQTMDRAWDTVFVGTRTGFVLQFECKNNMLIPVSTVKFSDQSILALRALKEGPRKVLLVAARSENVTIKDAQTGLLLRTLAGPKMTVYTLLFEDGKVYCGTSSHQIHVFDYASGSHVGAHEGGKGAVCLRATGGLLFAGCYDGCVYVYKEGETRPLAQLRGPSLMLLSLAIVGTKIIAGYKDRSLYIWKIPLSILQEMIL